MAIWAALSQSSPDPSEFFESQNDRAGNDEDSGSGAKHMAVVVGGGGSGDIKAGAAAASQIEGWVRSGNLKPPARAVEKAVVCYGGDVSFLTDLCRGRLFFDSLPALTHCLARIGTCPAVRVLRLKNSLLARRDSARSAGFRVCRSCSGASVGMLVVIYRTW